MSSSQYKNAVRNIIKEESEKEVRQVNICHSDKLQFNKR